MDFFRRLDKDADGRLTRDEFIDCILKCSKFLLGIFVCVPFQSI